MDVHVIPSSVGGGRGQFLAGLLVNGRVALDAGGVGFYRTPADQAKITDVFLTHSHIDHVASLAILVDNVYQIAPHCPVVRGLPHTLDALRSDLFNDRLMPDFLALARAMPPFLEFTPFAVGETVCVAGLRVTSFAVDHTVPTVGFVVEDEAGNAVAYVTDTRAPGVVADIVKKYPKLRGLFLEASFPDAMTKLADVSGHLTSSQFLAAARGVPAGVKVLAVHIKPRFYDAVTAEIAAGKLSNVAIAEPGRTYAFE